MSNMLVNFIQELYAEIIVTALTAIVMAGWHRLRKEPFEVTHGFISRYDLLHWAFTIAALIGCAFLSWALLGGDPPSRFSVILSWMAYFLLSLLVVCCSYLVLVYQKSHHRPTKVQDLELGYSQILQSTFAKLAAIFLWIGILVVSGPDLSLLLWSLGVGIAVDGYAVWRILKID